MMNPLYLTDEEVRERNRLNFSDFQRTMRYGTFASEFGWDKVKTDRNDSDYLANMYSYVGAKGMATSAYTDTERSELAKANDAEDETTRDKPLKKIREINPWFEELSDEQLRKHIKRGERKPLEV